MAVPKVPAVSAAAQLAGLLDSPEIAALVSELEATRWTGRPGYPIRSMVGMALAKSVYAVPTWTRTVALVREHAALRVAIAGVTHDVPSVYACYRFAVKLRTYGNMHSDPDASWGHRSAVSTRKGGGFYGYKIDMAVCTATDLTLAWNVRTASEAEANHALPLIDVARERGFAVETCAMDKGYDNGPIYKGCEERDCRPIIPLRKTHAVKRGEHKPPTCEHGDWRFAGADYTRKATKWRCPTGECKPASQWVKADRLHPLIPRHTDRSRKLYHSRGAVEREFGRLKNDWALAPLRVRGLDRVKLHADLTILAKLSCALSRARAVPLAA